MLVYFDRGRTSIAANAYVDQPKQRKPRRNAKPPLPRVWPTYALTLTFSQFLSLQVGKFCPWIIIVFLTSLASNSVMANTEAEINDSNVQFHV